MAVKPPADKSCNEKNYISRKNKEEKIRQNMKKVRASLLGVNPKYVLNLFAKLVSRPTLLAGWWGGCNFCRLHWQFTSRNIPAVLKQPGAGDIYTARQQQKYANIADRLKRLCHKIF